MQKSLHVGQDCQKGAKHTSNISDSSLKSCRKMSGVILNVQGLLEPRSRRLEKLMHWTAMHVHQQDSQDASGQIALLHDTAMMRSGMARCNYVRGDHGVCRKFSCISLILSGICAFAAGRDIASAAAKDCPPKLHLRSTVDWRSPPDCPDRVQVGTAHFKSKFLAWWHLLADA